MWQDCCISVLMLEIHRKLRRSGAGRGGALQQHRRCAAPDSARTEDLGRAIPPRRMQALLSGSCKQICNSRNGQLQLSSWETVNLPAPLRAPAWCAQHANGAGFSHFHPMPPEASLWGAVQADCSADTWKEEGEFCAPSLPQAKAGSLRHPHLYSVSCGHGSCTQYDALCAGLGGRDFEPNSRGDSCH